MEDIVEKANQYAFTFRSFCKIGDDQRDAGLVTPDTIERIDDIPYAKEDKLQVLDIYRPKSMIENNDKKLPVIVNVHGGGWVYGTKETYQFYCMSLAEKGFAVVNYSYRLSPEYKYPAQIEDEDLVFRWIYNNKDKYSLDVDNVFAVGDSAGGHLLAIYSSMLVNKEYASTVKFDLQKNIKPNAIGLNCGAYRLYKISEEEKELDYKDSGVKQEGTDEENILLYCFLDTVNDETKELLSPILHINEKFPSTILMSCVGDFLKFDFYAMKRELKSKGIEVVEDFRGTDEEPLAHVYHVDLRNAEGKKCNEAEINFFKKHIK